MAKEIVLYNADKTEQLFPKTEASSVYDSATGFTVRDEISDLDQRITKIEDNPVDLSGYYTKVEVDNKETAQNIYIQGLDERVSELEDGNVEIDLSDYYTKDEVNGKLQGKQDTLVSGTNIKTINGETILGSGEIAIEADGLKIVKLTQAEYDALGEYDPDVLYAISDSTGNTIDLSGYYTKEEVNEALSDKQDTLVSGTNIKTINGYNILGSGDVVISSTSEGLNLVEITQAEYDALEEYNPDYIYVITDGQSSLLAMIQALEARVAALEGK